MSLWNLFLLPALSCLRSVPHPTRDFYLLSLGLFTGTFLISCLIKSCKEVIKSPDFSARLCSVNININKIYSMTEMEFCCSQRLFLAPYPPGTSYVEMGSITLEYSHIHLCLHRIGNGFVMQLLLTPVSSRPWYLFCGPRQNCKDWPSSTQLQPAGSFRVLTAVACVV